MHCIYCCLIIVNFLYSNEFVGNSHISQIKAAVLVKFGWYSNIFNIREMHPEFDMRPYVIRSDLFASLQVATGVRFSKSCLKRCRDPVSFMSENPISAADLDDDPFQVGMKE